MEARHLIKEKLIDGTAKRVHGTLILMRESDLADMLEQYHEPKLKSLVEDEEERSTQRKALDFLAIKGIEGRQAKTIAEWMVEFQGL